jgi:hypothetical protein
VSALVVLGFSIIMFLISYGLMFTLVPMTLGQVWTVMNENNMPIPDQNWQDTYNNTQSTLQYIIPLVPSIGIVLVVIKVLMVASVRGRD